ncbi:hypothetical protein DPMN_161325 [Dreissena polymorpha]|uniref:Uncharacterized protein n=1 Tax=Dreissena polymorpha TaxID=45954 RepID=A0A9D4EQ79_DREPO|nr:hypothetical protein DPMN_161325 [Dreissena polymorpha]
MGTAVTVCPLTITESLTTVTTVISDAFNDIFFWHHLMLKTDQLNALQLSELCEKYALKKQNKNFT